MAECCIALGGNTGEPQTTFDNALIALKRHGVDVIAVSSTITSAPMGADAGGLFCNAAATISTQLSPQDLLNALHNVEEELGRTRSVHWGPRALDLDLIFYDDVVLESEDIVVPHPSMWYRHFVLNPLNEIASHWKHPILDETVDTMQLKLKLRPLQIDLALGPGVSVANLEAALPIDHGLRLQAADVQPQLSERCFASFFEGPDPQANQPALEKGRIIRVPLSRAAKSRLDAWQQAIRDFHSAAVG